MSINSVHIHTHIHAARLDLAQCIEQANVDDADADADATTSAATGAQRKTRPTENLLMRLALLCCGRPKTLRTPGARLARARSHASADGVSVSRIGWVNAQAHTHAHTNARTLARVSIKLHKSSLAEC